MGIFLKFLYKLLEDKFQKKNTDIQSKEQKKALDF